MTEPNVLTPLDEALALYREGRERAARRIMRSPRGCAALYAVDELRVRLAALLRGLDDDT